MSLLAIAYGEGGDGSAGYDDIATDIGLQSSKQRKCTRSLSSNTMPPLLGTLDLDPAGLHERSHLAKRHRSYLHTDIKLGSKRNPTPGPTRRGRPKRGQATPETGRTMSVLALSTIAMPSSSSVEALRVTTERPPSAAAVMALAVMLVMMSCLGLSSSLHN